MDTNIKLKLRRQELQLTMLDVAKLVGVSEATISRWESGDIANMRRDKIVKLANALQVTPSYIMGTNGETNVQKNYTPHQIKVIDAYISKPEMQPAVDKLLGVEMEKNISFIDDRRGNVFIAAASGKEHEAKEPDIKTIIEIEKLHKKHNK